jgi:hypothetical protein
MLPGTSPDLTYGPRGPWKRARSVYRCVTCGEIFGSSEKVKIDNYVCKKCLKQSAPKTSFVTPYGLFI